MRLNQSQLKPVFMGVLIAIFLGNANCTTLPDPKHNWVDFPSKKAFYKKPSRRYKELGIVRSRVNYLTLDPYNNEEKLCQNYFNKAVLKLIDYAKDKGADAVIEVRSVVVEIGGKVKAYTRAECFDDGQEGQVLAKGIAVKWLPPKRLKSSKE